MTPGGAGLACEVGWTAVLIYIWLPPPQIGGFRPAD